MRMNYEVEYNYHDQWIVFLHGAGGNIKTWKHQREAFKSHYNLLLIDLRDHGESVQVNDSIRPYSFELIAQDVLKLLDELRIPSAHFMALSMGSLIIQKIAELRPEIIEKAVVAGGIFDVSRMMILFARSAAFLSYVMPFRWSYWIFSLIIMPKKNHQEARMIFIKQAKKLSPAAYRRWIGLYREFSSMTKSFHLNGLKFPLLAVSGEEDYVFLDAAKRFSARQTLAQLEIIPKSGHIVNIEKHQLFNQKALDWMRRK